MTKSRITTYTARPQPAKNRTVCAAQRGKILQKTLPAKYGRSLHSVHAQSRAARGRRKKTDEGSTATPEPREGFTAQRQQARRPTLSANLSAQFSAKSSFLFSPAFSQAFSFQSGFQLPDKPGSPFGPAFRQAKLSFEPSFQPDL